MTDDRDELEEAEELMHRAASRAKLVQQRSLALGCALPAALLVVLVILALSVGGKP